MVPFMQAIEETSPLSSAVRKNVIQKSVENIVKFSLSATARGEEEGDTHASSFPPSSRVVKMAQQLLQRVNQRISEVIRLEFGAEREGRPPSALQVAMVLKQFGLALHQLPESKLPGVSSRILALVQRWTELCLTEVTDCLHANKGKVAKHQATMPIEVCRDALCPVLVWPHHTHSFRQRILSRSISPLVSPRCPTLCYLSPSLLSTVLVILSSSLYQPALRLSLPLPHLFIKLCGCPAYQLAGGLLRQSHPLLANDFCLRSVSGTSIIG